MLPDESDIQETKAARIYAEYLQRGTSGGHGDIGALCRRYPEFAAELREIHGRLETIHRSEFSSCEDTSPPAVDHADYELHPDTARYDFRERLGQGGMGVIFRVWDGKLHRELAMKLIRDKREPGNDHPGRVTNPRLLARFVREAEITARLDHPGVVPIHDISTDEHGRIFFTMRLVQGERLDAIYELARRREKSWTQTRALDAVVKICETIAFAHSRGVIHRDLKPENIMVGQFGETYVMDWGLAKYLRKTIAGTPPEGNECPPPSVGLFGLPGVVPDSAGDIGSDSETVEGAVLGTAPFMPPEQAAGRLDELDERTDIYSVGAILYELLSGQRPYVPRGTRSNRQEVVQAVIAGPPASIMALNPRVPVELVAICEKAMARRKEHRYQTMREMAEDLRAYLENRVVRAYQTGALAEFRKWVARNRGLALASALTILVAIVGLSAVVGVQSSANTRLTKANEQIQKETRLKQAALEKEQAARTAADEQRLKAQGLLLARQSADILPVNPTQALLLAIESDKKCPGAAANTALLRALAVHHEARTLSGHRGPIRTAAVSRDGTRIVTASEDGTSIVWNVQTGEQTWLVGHRNHVFHANFSPDGRRVVTASIDGTAAIWDSETGERLQVLAGHANWVRQAVFSPDGALVATVSNDGTARLFDSATGDTRAILAGHAAHLFQTAFSPDGSVMLTGSADRTVRLWETATGRQKAVLQGHSGGIGVALFSADGSRVLTAAALNSADSTADGQYRDASSTDRTARIWDVATGELLFVLEHTAPVTAAAYGKATETLVTGARDGTIRLWDVATGENRKTTDLGDSTVTSVAFSPDDRMIAAATAGGSAWLWDSLATRSARRLIGHTEAVVAVAFISQRQVMTASRDRTVRLWNVHSPGTVETLSDSEGNHMLVTIGPRRGPLVVWSRSSPRAALCTFPEGDRFSVLEHQGPITQVRFNPEGSVIATRTASGDVQLWSAGDGSRTASLMGTGRATELAFAGGGRLMIVSQPDRVVTTWDVATGALVDRLEFPEADYLRPSPDGRFILAWSDDSLDAELWNTTVPERVARLPSLKAESRIPLSAGFGPDGSSVVTWSISPPGARLWETATGRLIAELDEEGRMVGSIAFSTEGGCFVTISGSTVARLWDVKTGRMLSRLGGGNLSISKIFVGPDGERVVIHSGDKVMFLWNGRTGKSIGLLGDRDADIDSARFSGDGRLLLTLSANRTEAVLWNARTGERIADIPRSSGDFTDAAISRDGQWIVTGADDGTAHVWPVRWTDIARRHVPRDLTPNEHDLFGIDTAEHRARYREHCQQRALGRLLIQSTHARTQPDQASVVQAIIDRALRDFVGSMGTNAGKGEIAAALNAVDEYIRETQPPPNAALEALARFRAEFGERGESPEAADRVP